MTDGLRYLLDTDVVSHILRWPGGTAARRLLEEGADSAAVSSIVACELRFGAVKKESPPLLERVEQFLETEKVLPLISPVDRHYARIRSSLERAVTPIGPNDLLIASHAKALGLTVATGNHREFSRVPGLEVENWLEDESAG